MKNLALTLSAFPYFYGIGSAYQFAVGPLLYLYVKSIIDPDFKFTLKDLLHFVPFFFMHFYEFPEFILRSYMDYAAHSQGGHSFAGVAIRFLIWHLQPLLYAAMLLHLLRRYGFYLKAKFTAQHKLNFTWMRNVFFTYAAVWSLKAGVELFLPYTIYSHKLYYIPASIILTAFHIYIIAYLGLNRSEIFPEDPKLPQRYKTSQLSQKKSKEYLQRLITNMETEKSFTDPKLTLPLLANRLSINSRYLSQVINENLGQNFYDFINGYRIAEAQKKLTDPDKDKYTIEAIAFEVGFNSKAAFYSTFKKQTNMTPSQYREIMKRKSHSLRTNPRPNKFFQTNNQ